MLPYLLLPLCLLFATSSVNINRIAAQDESLILIDKKERQKVIDVVNTLHQGINMLDSNSLDHLFHKDIQSKSINTTVEGQLEIKSTAVADFLTNIETSTARKQQLVYPYTEVRISGNLATIWTPFTLYSNGIKESCGIRSIQLAKVGLDKEWKIISMIDDRSGVECFEQQALSPIMSIDSFATNWHKAAANADAETFFKNMKDGAIYIGTDAGEHWDKTSFMNFAKPYFDEGKAWTFKSTERHVFHYPDENIAYWDELLDTWMGPCRGTGIVYRSANGGWQLLHYTLSVTISNDLIQKFIALDKD